MRILKSLKGGRKYRYCLGNENRDKNYRPSWWYCLGGVSSFTDAKYLFSGRRKVAHYSRRIRSSWKCCDRTGAMVTTEITLKTRKHDISTFVHSDIKSYFLPANRPPFPSLWPYFANLNTLNSPLIYNVFSSLKNLNASYSN